MRMSDQGTGAFMSLDTPSDSAFRGFSNAGVCGVVVSYLSNLWKGLAQYGLQCRHDIIPAGEQLRIHMVSRTGRFTLELASVGTLLLPLPLNQHEVLLNLKHVCNPVCPSGGVGGPGGSGRDPFSTWSPSQSGMYVCTQFTVQGSQG
jgi:hypothetical protein